MVAAVGLMQTALMHRCACQQGLHDSSCQFCPKLKSDFYPLCGDRNTWGI